ncbi:MAG: glycosyltransferase family 4 protein [candidate division WOR-3 bacterium]
MKVHMDVTPVWNPNPRGIGTYIINLIERLIDLGVEVHASFKFSRLQRFMWARRLPHLAKKKVMPFWMGRIELFHGTNRYLLPGGFPKVLTVHDMVEFYDQTDFWFPPGKKRRMREKTKRCFSMNPAAVIAVSEFARSEVLRFTDYPAEKVRVIYHGIPRWARPYSREEYLPIIKKYALSERRFLVFVGQPESRKNLSLVLKGMSGVPGIKLLVAGGRLEPAESEIAEKLRLWDRIVQVPFVPGPELGALLSASLALAFPSKYEGFGLPVIEAMASAAPVITSTHPSVAEAAGDAGVLVDPYDEDGFRDAVMRLIDDEGFVRLLIERGLLRARRFSWTRTAGMTLEVYRDAAHG